MVSYCSSSTFLKSIFHCHCRGVHVWMHRHISDPCWNKSELLNCVLLASREILFVRIRAWAQGGCAFSVCCFFKVLWSCRVQRLDGVWSNVGNALGIAVSDSAKVCVLLCVISRGSDPTSSALFISSTREECELHLRGAWWWCRDSSDCQLCFMEKGLGGFRAECGVTKWLRFQVESESS